MSTPAPHLVNWARNQSFHPCRIHRPSTLEELRSAVAASPSIRTYGSGHSFNRAADPAAGDALLLDAMPLSPEIDARHCTLGIGARATYADAALALENSGWALHNLASLPHISVGGAAATGTHGSGAQLGSLASAVAAMELVTADGSCVRISRGDADFNGAVVHLGALGVVHRVWLDIVPAYEVRQDVYEDMPFDAALEHFDAVMGAAYSVSLFTAWRPDGAHVIEQVWVKSLVGPDAPPPPASPWLGAARAAHKLHPIRGVDPVHCTEQGGVPGPWHARLPHFKAEFTPSVGEELQAEFNVAASHAPAALRALSELREAIAPLLWITEVRAIARDVLWMSPHGGDAAPGERGFVAIHFTLKNDNPAGVAALLPRIEAALAPFAPRPHWGKLYTLPPAELEARYPRARDFDALVARMDPMGKFGGWRGRGGVLPGV